MESEMLRHDNLLSSGEFRLAYQELVMNATNNITFPANFCINVNDMLAFHKDWTTYPEIQACFFQLKNNIAIIIYGVLYALIFLIGSVGNGLLIYSIVKRKRTTVANIFLINLAISDLLLCITAVPITPVLAFMKSWIFGVLLCKLVPACQAISVLISSWCLCYIAMDRYRSIVTPLKEPWSMWHAKILLLIAYLTATITSIPLYAMQSLKPLVMGQHAPLCGEFCGEFNWREDDPLKIIYGLVLLLIQLVIPGIVMTFCYWKILQKVRTDWLVDEGSMLTAAQQAQTAMRKRRVMYVLILMVVAFMASWLPLSTINIIKDLQIFEITNQMYFKLLNVHAIAMSSVVWNFALYFFMSKRHRRALKDDMTWLTAARRQTTIGVLSRFTPSPSVSVVYRRALERHLGGAGNFRSRRGTLADPTCMARERAHADLTTNCFLLVPLMPLCQSVTRKNSHLAIDEKKLARLSRTSSRTSRRLSSTITNATRETKDW